MRRYGGAPESWLDLSTGINPGAWPMPALAAEVWRRLPSRRDEEQLVAAARQAWGVPNDAAIVPAPGTQALIQWLPRLAPAGAVAILGPTYSEHALCWASAGHAVIATDRIEGLDAPHAVLVNPNNPDGRMVGHTALEQALVRTLQAGGWLVIDESFVDLCPNVSAIDLCGRGAVVLRSFGKFYGLAGLRLGFAVASHAVAQRLASALGPWAVSGPALAIGAAALADTSWAEQMRVRLAAEAGRLDAVLAAAGLAVVGGTSLFRLARHAQAFRLHHALAQRQIWTRAFTDRPDLLRFGLPPDAAGLDRLAAALGAAN